MKLLAILIPAALWAAGPAVRSYEGSLTIPTYEHSGRETEPPLFAQSKVQGMYPFPSFVMPFKPGGPRPREYRAVFVENEYLKLTYIPEFGGRFFSLYDKLRKREVWYRNDVIKPAPYNPRNGWPQSGMELTGPHDVHMLTLHGEPFWANQIVRKADGAVSLVLGQIDPVYQMKVNFAATLHPGVAALELTVFCYNTRAARMPQMLWVNTAVDATPKTRFLYPMSRTVGHTTADIADWPVFNGTDYSWDRNNQNMLGVFGIDIYDNFQGAYQFDRDYGVFRWADRRLVQGMKMWTFGHGPGAKNHERGYTDNAGPYVELQSGRHVWDGHYEWVPPHKVESWSEWWVPVSGTGGLTTLTREVALNVEARDGKLALAFAAARRIPIAAIVVRSHAGELLRRAADLDPAAPFMVEIPGDPEGLVVTVADSSGKVLLDYRRPEEPPGRKEYTPFTRPLEQPRKPPEQMTAEELTLAAESRFKELDAAGGMALLEKALAADPGYSRANLQLGIQHFAEGRNGEAIGRLEKAIERDPYAGETHYYLAMTRLASGDEARAERELYYIWPGSPYFGEREHYLGRFAFWRGERGKAIEHLERAVSVNAEDLLSRLMLAMAYRVNGEREAALREIAALERIDPTSRPARAERFFLTGEAAAKEELLRLTGGQSQEALSVAAFYREMRQWRDAAAILQLVEQNHRDPYGTPPEFFYTLAYCQRRAGDEAGRQASLGKARLAWRNIDRFPYRPESEAPLAEAIDADSGDWVARHALACLLYYLGRHAEAIRHWESAVEANPRYFSARRALGLAYAEQAASLDKAVGQLERAIELDQGHFRTINDLSSLYAKAGKFDEQLRVLRIALERSPGDDDLVDSVLTAHLVRGDYEEAEKLIGSHRFSPRHRTYTLRDKYRMMRAGAGSRAFNKGDYAQALSLFTAALSPPESLGVDDFAGQVSPRIEYYRGRALDGLGRAEEARQAYEKSTAGVAHLTGDRDSWSAENFFMVLSLERLGRRAEAERLRERFEAFGNGERNDRSMHQRAAALYLLGLVEKSKGRADESRRLISAAVEAVPDFLPARMELRGDVPRER
jgi:tetratricopeptide (TPR) repeat protein